MTSTFSIIRQSTSTDKVKHRQYAALHIGAHIDMYTYTCMYALALALTTRYARMHVRSQVKSTVRCIGVLPLRT